MSEDVSIQPPEKSASDNITKYSLTTTRGTNGEHTSTWERHAETGRLDDRLDQMLYHLEDTMGHVQTTMQRLDALEHPSSEVKAQRLLIEIIIAVMLANLGATVALGIFFVTHVLAR